MSNGRLHDRTTAVVTGGGSGIGEGIAQALASEGCRVIISGRNEVKLRAAAESFQKAGAPAIQFRSLDVADREAVGQFFQWATQTLGRVDILVNSAGTNIVKRSMAELDPADWDKLLAVNATGAYNCMHAVLPQMRERRDGLIVNISSVAGVRASMLGGVAYTASKFALASLSHCVALEEKDHGIRVTNVHPGGGRDSDSRCTTGAGLRRTPRPNSPTGGHRLTGAGDRLPSAACARLGHSDQADDAGVCVSASGTQMARIDGIDADSRASWCPCMLKPKKRTGVMQRVAGRPAKRRDIQPSRSAAGRDRDGRRQIDCVWVHRDRPRSRIAVGPFGNQPEQPAGAGVGLAPTRARIRKTGIIPCRVSRILSASISPSTLSRSPSGRPASNSR